MSENYLVSKILGSARHFALFVLLIALFFATGIGIAYLLAVQNERPGIVPAEPNQIIEDNQIGDSAAQKLTVNAQLQVKGQFYLAPTSVPTDAEAGTLVFDQSTSTLQYFNGTEFVPLTAQQPVPQGGVTSLQGQTGAITFTPGAGIAINGTTISNSGILGVNGVGGDISVTTANGIASLSLVQSIAPTASPTFAGLSLNSALGVSSGGTGAAALTANGVLVGNGTSAITSVDAPAAGLCLISTAGAPDWGLCAGGGGAGVASLNGLMGTLDIANASGVGTTITIDDASTSAKGIASFNSTNFSVTSGAVNTIQNIATTSSPTFAGLTLSAPLSVSSGGIGASSLTLNAVLIGNGTSAPQQLITVTPGQCLVSTAGAPIFTTCPGSGGVASIDGQTGVVTMNNATGAAGVITIDDATTGSKGIASFNSTNFSVTSGAVNTIQGIATSSSPTFAGLTLTSALSVGNGGTGATSASGARTNLQAAASGANADITSLTALTTITPGAALTIGASGQQLTLQGNASTTLRSTNAGSTTTVGFNTPTANVAINFPALTAGTYQVCTTSGNCLGSGGGANTALSNLASVAINTHLLPGSTTIDLGSAANPFRDLYIGGTATNNFQISGTATGARDITLPDQSGEVCLDTGNCIGSGGGAPAGASYLTLALNGNLSDERVLNAGTNISFTDGGANGNLTVSTVANPTFSTSVTTPLVTSAGALNITPGGSLTVGATTQSFLLQGTQTSTITARNGSNITTINFENPTASATLQFPALAAGTYEICTSDGNCVASTGVDSLNTFTGAVTIQGTANQVTVNNSLGTITLSTPQDINTGSSPTFSGLTLTSLTVGADTITDFTGTGLQVVANALTTTLGVSVDLTSEVTGTLPIANGGTGGTATPTQGGIAYGTGAAYSFTSAGTSGQCLVSNGTSAPTFQTCAGGGSGVTLQAAYNNGNTITTSDGRDISFTLADTANDSHFVINVPSGSGSAFQVQDNGTNMFYVSPGLSVVGIGSGYSLNAEGTFNVGGTTSFNGDVNVGDTSTDRLTVTAHLLGASPLVFQGATNNGFETTFAFVDPTADRTITFGNESGTVCTTAASASCLSAYASSGLFTDGGTQTYLTSTTDELVVGGTASLSAKLSVVNTSNQEALLIRAHSSQSTSNPLILMQSSGGSEIARLNADAVGNISFGLQAGDAMTIGQGNINLGSNAGGSMQDGSDNIAIGGNALLASVSNSNNIAIGYSTLMALTQGGNNVAIGDSAMLVGTNVQDSVAIGNSALYSNNDGWNLVAIGTGALFSSLGDNNIAIGYHAGDNITTGTNNLIIGHDLDAASATGNYQLNIAGIIQSNDYTARNLYFGAGVTHTSAASQDVTLNATGGSGTNIGGADFTIAGGRSTGNAVGGSILFRYSPSGSSGTSLNALQTACSISGTNGSFSCPGTGSQSQRFGADAVAVHESLAVGHGANAGGAQSLAVGYFAEVTGDGGVAIGSVSSASNSSISVGSGAESDNSAISIGNFSDAIGDGNISLGSGASTNSYSIAIGQDSVSDGTGSIAIGRYADSNAFNSIVLGAQGTATAANQFVVGGDGWMGSYVNDVYFGGGVTTANAATRDVKINASGGSGSNVGGADLLLAGGRGTGTGVGGALLFQTAAAGSSGATLNPLTTRMAIEADGDLAVDTNTLFVDATNNRVGIGTTTTTNGILTVDGTAPGVSNGSGLYVSTSLTSDFNQRGITSITSVTPSATGGARIYAAGHFQVQSSSSNLSNDLLMGMNAAVHYSGSGALDDAIGGSFGVVNLSTGTIDNAKGLYVGQPINAGGGTITNSVGAMIVTAALGTNNTGLLITTSETIPTGNWSIFSDSTSNSALAGSLRVGGTTAPSATLDVTGTAAVSSTLTVGGNILPNAAGTLNVGSATAEFNNLYVGDNNGLRLGLDQDALLAYDEATDDRVELTGTGASLFIEDRLGLGKQQAVVADDGAGTPAVYTLNPTSSYVSLVCNDSNGCTITMGETSAKDGDLVVIVNNCANSTFADTPNVSELAGGFTANLYDTLTLLYGDQWIELSRSDNSATSSGGGCV